MARVAATGAVMRVPRTSALASAARGVSMPPLLPPQSAAMRRHYGSTAARYSGGTMAAVALQRRWDCGGGTAARCCGLCDLLRLLGRSYFVSYTSSTRAEHHSGTFCTMVEIQAFMLTGWILLQYAWVVYITMYCIVVEFARISEE